MNSNFLTGKVFNVPVYIFLILFIAIGVLVYLYMNGNLSVANIGTLFFYLFIMLLIAFVVSSTFRKCLLRLLFPKSWVKKIGEFFKNYLFACDTEESEPPKKENFRTESVKSDSVKSTPANEKKIVFTAYTADWCPHCVTFKNESYGQLKDYFKNNSKIQITNVDCTNDTTGKIKTKTGKQLNGYPTLVINTYTCNNTTEEMYEGPRDAGSIIKYLQKL
jgi:thiol:disulfide interchange protein